MKAEQYLTRHDYESFRQQMEEAFDGAISMNADRAERADAESDLKVLEDALKEVEILASKLLSAYDKPKKGKGGKLIPRWRIRHEAGQRIASEAFMAIHEACRSNRAFAKAWLGEIARSAPSVDRGRSTHETQWHMVVLVVSLLSVRPELPMPPVGRQPKDAITVSSVLNGLGLNWSDGRRLKWSPEMAEAVRRRRSGLAEARRIAMKREATWVGKTRAETRAKIYELVERGEWPPPDPKGTDYIWGKGLAFLSSEPFQRGLCRFLGDA